MGRDTANRPRYSIYFTLFDDGVLDAVSTTRLSQLRALAVSIDRKASKKLDYVETIGLTAGAAPSYLVGNAHHEADG